MIDAVAHAIAPLKQKANADILSYRKRGALNPTLAYDAFKRESHVVTMLPQSVVASRLPMKPLMLINAPTSSTYRVCSRRKRVLEDHGLRGPKLSMQVMQRLRSYHATLAVLVVVAYATGDDNVFHAWLGYAVAAIIVMRLAWALTGVPQLGLARFYPHFEGLRLSTAMTHPAISRALLFGIATCVIAVTLTGIAMDQGHSIGMAGQTISSPALADSGAGSQRDAGAKDNGEDEHEDESVVGELHEALANLLMILIVTHVSYLVLFKRPLAQFMLFIQTPSKKDGAS